MQRVVQPPSQLSEVCHDVQVEPLLQPSSAEILTGYSANMLRRLVWTSVPVVSGENRFSRAQSDVQVFHRNVSSVCMVALSSQYTKYELTKHHKYKQ